MVKSDIWSEIRSDYEKAKYALRCPKNAETWHREEELGRYYLLKAYHHACDAEPKDELLFARILAMMAYESTISVRDRTRYAKFAKPSLDAYERAIQAGQEPTEKELKNIRYEADALLYEFTQHQTPYAERLKLIKGYERLEDFDFHDSKPVWFEHTENDARLKLQYGDTVVTFLFEGIADFRADGDPRANWISSFYCFPCFDVKGLITFETEYYKIICQKISVEAVERETSAE